MRSAATSSWAPSTRGAIVSMPPTPGRRADTPDTGQPPAPAHCRDALRTRDTPLAVVTHALGVVCGSTACRL